MANIGSKISQLRKQHNWSQEELASRIDSSRIMIGKYERGDNTPSVEVLIRLANTFEVTLDFIIGEGEFSSYDKDILRRIDDIERLDSETRKHLFFLIDNVIQNFKTKQAFA